MKIAYLTPQYPKVSHTFIRREILGLEALGHTVLRISVRPSESQLVVDPADRSESLKTLVLLNSPVALVTAFLAQWFRSPGLTTRVAFDTLRRGLGTGSGLVKPLAYLVEAAFLRKELAREGADHIHVHFGTNAATVAWILRRLGGPPYSMTIHGPDEWDATERHLLGPKFEDAAFSVMVSSFGIAQARRWVGPEHWDRLHEIHCNVDESFFGAAKPIEPGKQLRLVCVGRLTAQKGPLLLLDSFSALIESGVDARLVLAGDGEMRPEVEALISKYDLHDRVSITGWISEAEVREHILSAHCLVLPSFAEGLPVVVMEALALQRPVVSTYVAGIPELVRPGINGWLVPAGNTGALTDCLREVASLSTKSLDEMGRAGAQLVRERHDTKTEVARLERLFRAAFDQGAC